MLKIRFSLLNFHYSFIVSEVGNRNGRRYAHCSSRSDKRWKKESDSERHDFWIVRDPRSVLARHDATWQSLCPGRYEDVVEQTPPRRRAKRLQNVYAYHGSAYTSTPLALSDGTDIRLRCQPIVKGTIRRAGDGSAANHFHPSPSASSFSFFPISFYRFLSPPFLLHQSSSFYPPRFKIVNKRWRGRRFSLRDN